MKRNRKLMLLFVTMAAAVTTAAGVFAADSTRGCEDRCRVAARERQDECRRAGRRPEVCEREARTALERCVRSCPR